MCDLLEWEQMLKKSWAPDDWYQMDDDQYDNDHIKERDVGNRDSPDDDTQSQVTYVGWRRFGLSINEV